LDWHTEIDIVRPDFLLARLIWPDGIAFFESFFCNTPFARIRSMGDFCLPDACLLVKKNVSNAIKDQRVIV